MVIDMLNHYRYGKGSKIFLSDLMVRESRIVDSVDIEIRFFNRLASMGICSGAKVTMVKNNFLLPVIIDVNGNKVALGRKMAEKILLKEEEK